MPVWFPTALCLLAAAAAAQVPGAPAPAPKPLPGLFPPPTQAPKPVDAAPPPRGTARTFRGQCSEATSRDLFTSCDADGDDRLDIFETSEAFDALKSARDTGGFARFDFDRDGYVSWPEFDRALHDTLDRGGAFTVRTARPFAPPTPTPQAATPARKLLQLYDANKNGGLDPIEIDAYVAQDKLTPALGLDLKQADADRSGRVEEAELEAWLTRQFRGANLEVGTTSDLPPPWQRVDKDQNGSIDVTELAATLRLLDPALAVWAEQLLLALDTNGDGRLQPAELPGFRAGRDRRTADAAPRQLPLPAQLR